MRYWVSWHQPTDDYRPLQDPPNAAILGWWCSGYDSNDVPILCALIEAGSERIGKAAIEKDWPEAQRYRFFNEVGQDFLLSDRFPMSAWMKKRIQRAIA